MQARDQGIEIGGVFETGVITLEIKAHALLAAGHRQQFTVESHVPCPIQSRLGEGAIKRHTMAIALGIRQRAVHIKNERRQMTHANPPCKAVQLSRTPARCHPHRSPALSQEDIVTRVVFCYKVALICSFRRAVDARSKVQSD